MKEAKIRKSIKQNLEKSDFYLMNNVICHGTKKVSNMYFYVKESCRITTEEDCSTIYKLCVYICGELQKDEVEVEADAKYSEILNILRRRFGNKFMITSEARLLNQYFNTLISLTRLSDQIVEVQDPGPFRKDGRYFFNTGSEFIPEIKDEKTRYVASSLEPGKLGIKRTDVTEEKAALEFIKLIEVGEPDVMYMIVSYFLSAVLKEPMKSMGADMRSVLWIYGLTGTRKTTISILMANILKLNSLDIDGNFNDSEAYHQYLLFKNASNLTLIDDNAPGASYSVRMQIEDKIARLIRAQGDGAVRRRMDVKMSKQKELSLRGNVIITSEYAMSGGESSMARAISVEMKQSSLNLKKLAKRQKNVDIISTCVYNFIEWAMENYEVLQTRIGQFFDQKRHDLLSLDLHGRIKEQLIQLDISFSIFIQYCLERELIEEEKAGLLVLEHENVLNRYIAKSKKLMMTSKPAIVYLETIRDLLVSGKLKLIRAKSDNQPSKRMGWQDDNKMYLLEGAVFAEIRKYLNMQGRDFGLNSTDIYKLLDDNGVLEVNDSERGRTYTKKSSVYSNSHERPRTLVINKEKANAYIESESNDNECNFVYDCSFHETLQKGFEFKFKKERKDRRIVNSKKSGVDVSENGGPYVPVLLPGYDDEQEYARK